MTEGTKRIMTKSQEQMPDIQATNPRYKGAMMSDMARAMVTDPKVRARLEERWKERDRETPVNSSR